MQYLAGFVRCLDLAENHAAAPIVAAAFLHPVDTSELHLQQHFAQDITAIHHISATTLAGRSTASRSNDNSRVRGLSCLGNTCRRDHLNMSSNYYY